MPSIVNYHVHVVAQREILARDFRDPLVEFDRVHIKSQTVLKDIGHGAAAKTEQQRVGFFWKFAADRIDIISVVPFWFEGVFINPRLTGAVHKKEAVVRHVGHQKLSQKTLGIIFHLDSFTWLLCFDCPKRKQNKGHE